MSGLSDPAEIQHLLLTNAWPQAFWLLFDLARHLILPYLVAHWRGKLPLPVSYWVNGIALSAALGAIVVAIGSSLDFTSEYRLSALAAMALWAGIVFTFVWQFIGIWRSASRYQRDKKVWGIAAKLASLVVATQIGYVLYAQAMPQIAEYARIFAGKDAVGSYQLRVLRDATELEIAGAFAFGLTDDTRTFLDAHPTIQVVHLASQGGRIAEARALADLIEERKLTTFVRSGCFSACVIAYAAGSERLIERKGVLGFHQYSFPGTNQSDFGYEYERDRSYLRSRGVKEAFISKVFETPSDDFWTPSHEELFAAGYITRYIQPAEVALSGVKLSELDDLESELAQNPLYAAVRDADPAAYESIMSTVRSAFEKGRSLADIRAVVRPIVQELYVKRLALTSDEALLAFARLLVDQMATLKDRDPQLCYAYGFDIDGADVQPEEHFTADLLAREVSVGAEVIKRFQAERQLPTEASVATQLEHVFTSLTQEYSRDVVLMSQNSHTTEERAKMCSMTLSMYEEILRLPSFQGVPLLRYLFSAS